MSDYVRDLTGPRAWARENAERLGHQFDTDATVTDGIPRWRSNGAVPPADVCALWEHLGKPFDPQKTAAARRADDEAFIAEYRRNWRPPSGEMLAEMRANGLVGECVDVVANIRFRVPPAGNPP